MNDMLKLKYKVGQIEFEAEGSADAVEQQRINFMNAVLPAAVSAVMQTHAVSDHTLYVEEPPHQQLLVAGTADESKKTDDITEIDYSRTSLPAFLKKYGVLGDQDFTLFAAWFDEQKNGTKVFSSEDVKRYYLEGRRSAYSNNGVLLRCLVKKGYIMDAPTPEEKSGKHYMLTSDGIAYMKSYTPKEQSGEKKKQRTKSQKSTNKMNSQYTEINADDLSLKSYPALKSLHGSKAQVIMAMYIVTNEGRGEWFTVEDVIYILVNIFEVPANIDMINGVFKRNKSMFATDRDPNNAKAFRRKLLSGAKDFATKLIAGEVAE